MAAWHYGHTLVQGPHPQLGCHLPGCLCTSHQLQSVREVATVAHQAELQKQANYVDLTATHHFVLVAIRRVHMEFTLNAH